MRNWWVNFLCFRNDRTGVNTSNALSLTYSHFWKKSSNRFQRNCIPKTLPKSKRHNSIIYITPYRGKKLYKHYLWKKKEEYWTKANHELAPVCHLANHPSKGGKKKKRNTHTPNHTHTCTYHCETCPLRSIWPADSFDSCFWWMRWFHTCRRWHICVCLLTGWCTDGKNPGRMNGRMERVIEGMNGWRNWWMHENDWKIGWING